MIKKITARLLPFVWMGTSFLSAAEPNTVVATIEHVGLNPASVAVTPDNLFAYVVNNNENSVPGGDTVTVLNLTHNTIEKVIHDSSFQEPYRLAINKAGTLAYVANSNGATVSIINTASNTVVGLINGFDGPSGFVIAPNGKLAYVNNYGGPLGVGSGNGTTVNIVNLETNTIVGTIIVSLAPAAIALSPNGAFLYVVCYVDGNPGTGVVNVVDTKTNSIVHTIPGFSGPFGIAITPNGRFAYVTNFGSNNFAPIGNTVSVIDLCKNEITATIPLGIQPAGIAITPDGCLAYVTNYNTLYLGPNFTNLTAGEGIVNIIDLCTNKVIPPAITVGSSPNAVAISPNGLFAYVTNYTSDSVSVINLSPKIVAQGCQVVNRFLTRTDLINRLTWTVSGTSSPVKYCIYRNAQLTDLAGVARGCPPFVFFDHNRRPCTTCTYYIVGTNGVGTPLDPVRVVVAPRGL